MKFSDGNWHVPEHLHLLNPVEVFDARDEGDSLLILAPTTPQPDRANQINAKLLRLRFFSPMEGVIGVRFEHFRGGLDKGPHFELYPDAAFKPEISIGEKAAELKSGNLTVRVSTAEGWRIDFLRDGKVISGSDYKAAGHCTDKSDNDQTYMFERLDLGVGTKVYGLGERFTDFVKNGQMVDIWNRDGGANTDQAYKNIPFFLTNRGWGLFVNDPGRVEFEIGSEKVSKATFSVPGEALEYYFIDGPDPKSVIDRYTQLTGRPALPKQWSFGLWLTTSFTTEYDENTVTGFLDGMAERNIPLHVFHFDCFWMRGLHWCDFEWDPETFPDPEAMLARYKERGLHICVWINPYIAQESRLFDEGKENGYLIKREDGSVWQWDMWQPGQAVVDFTNPEACDWYAGYLKGLVGQGVDCFKTDFGERIPTDVAYHDGSDPETMHNYYTFLYNKVVFDALEESKGKGEAVLFARSATTGGQQFPVHWGGDCYSDYDSMAETLRSGLSLGLCGFGYWSHDIGGFEATAAADVYKRWCAFGLMSSHSRLHGSKSYRVPWLYDDEAVDVLRFFVNLKCTLMPTLYASAVEAPKTGLPMMRPMMLEFPEDRACDPLDRQYMLGDRLMVAPVLDQSGDVEFYLPKGRWTHLLSGDEVEGGSWRVESHGFMSMPLYVRPNSIMVFGANDQRPDYDYADGATYALYALEDGKTAEAVVYAEGGAIEQSVSVLRSGNKLAVSVADAARPWKLLLTNVVSIEGAGEGVTISESAEGVVLEGKGNTEITL
ncbi:alpha-xylosidase [Martelella mediterranea]|uniref:alpha-D-xyloside xylohydrolase n=1 Tax=Martelella mediterranea TaxID=293089 RepID=A0A4R3NX42_9HYPH|nr:alpha-xylosidase [Martelella mediterranea]TCT44944.1 alpha-xylosidase [Martelella mediterranea]